MLQQVDTPLKLYDKPVNLFVAGFIGSPQMNLLEANAADGQAKIGDYLRPGRPDRVEEDAAATSPSASVPRPGGWSATARVGCRSRSPWSRSSAPTASSTAPATSRAPRPTSSSGSPRATRCSKGDMIHVTTDPRNVHVFDTETGERLSDWLIQARERPQLARRRRLALGAVRGPPDGVDEHLEEVRRAGRAPCGRPG